MNLSSFPEMYERWLVKPLFQPWAEILLDRAGLTAGHRVLDVACGTGIVARVAMRRLAGTGRIVGIDIGPQMLAVARAEEPAIEWREGSADALPLRDGERFDRTLCHQGLQFFPDRPAAVREIRRSLERGGRLAVAVWTSVEETPFIAALHRVAEAHLGPFVDRRHGFGDPAALARLIAEGGFDDVQVESLTHTIRFADPAVFVRLNSTAVVGMSAGAQTMTNEERARLGDLIAEESAEVARRYTNGDGLAFDLGANVATARAA